MKEFVHLHVHSEYSLLDGACRINGLVSRAQELGQSSIAVTDHGVMYGTIDFYRAAKKKGIKPIIGCEVYVARRTRFDRQQQLDFSPYHLILLCRNRTGYQNLIELVSRGFTEGFYSRPRIDRDLLKEHSEGLICLSACLAGEIPRKLSDGDYEAALETGRFYRDLFGRENYFIELQNHGINEQKRILPLLRNLSKDLGVGMVATNDCHYLRREDAKIQKVLLCIQLNRTVDDPGDMEFPTEEFYVKSGDEMEELFHGYDGALQNTVEIAERCHLDFEFGHHVLPQFIAPNGEENNSYFRRLCQDGLKKNYGEHPDPSIQDRLQYELLVVEKMGYVDYYLIVYDFIRYAKEQGIPVGPGRGSGAGSLAAYCIGITGIDPIRYNLLFERFLNPERVSMPDFDIDFCYVRRQEVIDYVTRRYSADHVAQIITFGTMAARAAIRDVGRALGMSYQSVDVVAKAIPSELNMTLEKALKVSPDLKNMLEKSPQVKELYDTACALEGMPRHASTHAAGVVITRDPVMSYVPLAKNDEAVVTQFTMTTLEELGLLKMDFLGLRNLTVISRAEKMIQRRNRRFTMGSINLDDPEVYKMLSTGDAVGVFQFESSGMRQVMAQLGPQSIEDLIAVISLYRPGPMDSIPKYIENRHHPERVAYDTPLLEPILSVTYGCIVYQEQVMQICRSLAGFSYARADLVRRAMSKKKADVMAKEREAFIYGVIQEDGTVEVAGAIRNGVPEKTANKIFNEMSSFASYAFNKSHAAAYATVAYQTAYLKCHYPLEYFSALLTSIMDYTDKMVEYIHEIKKQGIQLLPPDINESLEGFTPSENGIRFGLLGLKGVGKGLVTNILQEREKAGKFQGFTDFCERVCGRDLNRRALESLIKSGSLDCFGYNRHQLTNGGETVLAEIEEVRKKNIAGQLSMFDNTGSAAFDREYQIPPCDEYSSQVLLQMEKETTGLYLSGHPLDPYEPMLRQMGASQIGELLKEESATDFTVTILGIVVEKRLKTTKSGGTMAFAVIEDRTGRMEMLIFPTVLERCGEFLNEGTPVVLKGRFSHREDEDGKLILEEALSPDSVRESKPVEAPAGGKLCLRISSRLDSRMEDVKNLLLRNQGNCPVYVCFSDTRKKMRAPESWSVRYSPDLQRKLADIIGEENTKYVD